MSCDSYARVVRQDKNEISSQGSEMQQNIYNWFCDITGTPEQDWLNNRAQSISRAPNGTDLRIQNSKTGEKYEAGYFSVHPLEQLRASLSVQQSTHPIFEVHIRNADKDIKHVDVAHLQAHAPPKSMFQVASNFNCAEVAHQHVAIDSGIFVSRLALDTTQGPAASTSAGISAITRMHAAFYDPQTDPQTWGQTNTRQIELLGHPNVSPHFPVTNGKLIFHGSEPQTYSKEQILPHIRIGLHQRARAYFGHRTAPFMEKVQKPPRIDQVFVAALNRRAPLPATEHIDSKTELLLQAAYEGTYLSAVRCNSRSLFLTLVGGGSFANPPQLIAQAIANAHQKLGRYTNIEKVILPLFPQNGIVQGQDIYELLCHEFAAKDMQHILCAVYL